MSKVTFEITMSLDGFVAGPNQTLEQPLGEGGEQIHEWMVGLASFRERHGLRRRREQPRLRDPRGIGSPGPEPS